MSRVKAAQEQAAPEPEVGLEMMLSRNPAEMADQELGQYLDALQGQAEEVDSRALVFTEKSAELADALDQVEQERHGLLSRVARGEDLTEELAQNRMVLLDLQQQRDDLGIMSQTLASDASAIRVQLAVVGEVQKRRQVDELVTQGQDLIRLMNDHLAAFEADWPSLMELEARIRALRAPDPRWTFNFLDQLRGPEGRRFIGESMAYKGTDIFLPRLGGPEAGFRARRPWEASWPKPSLVPPPLTLPEGKIEDTDGGGQHFEVHPPAQSAAQGQGAEPPERHEIDLDGRLIS